MKNGYPVRVEFEDVDSYKIVHHTKLLAYLERARTLYFSKDFRLDDFPYAVLVCQVSMRFIKAARMFDELYVTARICECKTYEFKVEQKIYRNGELLVKAYVGHALMNLKTRELVPVPGFLVDKMNDTEGT